MTSPVSSHAAGPQGFWRKYVFSLDHKVIGRQYLDLSLVALTTGMILSWLMRIHLAWPTRSIPFLGVLSPEATGGIITPEYYLSLMTMHGTICLLYTSPSPRDS